MSVNISIHPTLDSWKVIRAKSYGNDITLTFDRNSISIFSGKKAWLDTAIELRDKLTHLINNELYLEDGYDPKTS